MTKAKLTLSLLLILCFTATFAAVQQGFNYQAVLRDAQGAIMPNHNAAMRFTLHSDSINGPIAYQETGNVTTNPLGIFTVVVGGGIAVTGNLDTVDWSTPKFLQVEMDVNAGVNYTDMGTSQLMSVPFALYAAKAPAVSVTVMDVNSSGNVWVATQTDTIISGTPVWTVGGNSGVNGAAVFGTTDNSDIVFKRNGIEAMRLGADGLSTGSKNMGFGGISSPQTAVDINGAIALRDTAISVSTDFTINVGNRSYFNVTTTVNGGSAKMSLSDGLVRGQMLIVSVTATGANNIRLENNGASNNTKLSASSLDLGDSDSITFLWNGTDWIQTSYTDTN
ncbi:MAG: hypothetical protein U0V74_02465 [Chitinophagales bacterium]